MSIGLIEEVHDHVIAEDRTNPISLEEFIEYGLTMDDFNEYIYLLTKFQNELISKGHPEYSRDINSYSHPTCEKLIAFLKEKNLLYIKDDMDERHYLQVIEVFNNFDAEYRHDWLRYPKTIDEFRLVFERKLSDFWDEEDAYITDRFGSVSFLHDYDNTSDFGYMIRARKYNAKTEEFVILEKEEIKKILALVDIDKELVNEAIENHLAQMPSQHDKKVIALGLLWVRKMYDLYSKQEIIENVHEQFLKALSAPELYKFTEDDTLYVYCGESSCRKQGHFISKVRVEMSFYQKANKNFTLKRCSNCRCFIISLEELSEMFESYGVPRGKIQYDNDGSFSDFAESSIFREMGYSVSQSVGLSAHQRQSILEFAIKSGKASKYQVLKFLQQRMDINGAKSGNSAAFQKWKDDYEYIRKL